MVMNNATPLPRAVTSVRRITSLRFMRGMVSRGLAMLGGTQRAKVGPHQERLLQLARLEQWELDQRFHEAGER